MSEEVTYADLNFQDSSKRKNTKEFEKLEIKDCPAPSRIAPESFAPAWRHRALTVLCLLLLVGLGVLGGMYYITYKMQMKEINNLQGLKSELQRNVSLQMMDNINSTLMTKNLSITLQKLVTDLCRELYRTMKEHKCKPCPKDWIWHDDNCYLLSKTPENWQNSEKKCSVQNATLLTIRSESVLKFIKSQYASYTFWLKLYRPKQATTKLNRIPLNELIKSSDWLVNNTYNFKDQGWCGYFYNHYYNNYAYFQNCDVNKNFVCEKLANSVKIESIIMNKV